MTETIGFDVFNMSVTGGVSMTVTCSATDYDHVPVVFVDENTDTN